MDLCVIYHMGAVALSLHLSEELAQDYHCWPQSACPPCLPHPPLLLLCCCWTMHEAPLLVLLCPASMILCCIYVFLWGVFQMSPFVLIFSDICLNTPQDLLLMFLILLLILLILMSPTWPCEILEDKECFLYYNHCVWHNAVTTYLKLICLISKCFL